MEALSMYGDEAIPLIGDFPDLVLPVHRLHDQDDGDPFPILLE